MMCLGVGLFGFILFGTLCTSWTCMYISFVRLGKFSAISLFFSFSFSHYLFKQVFNLLLSSLLWYLLWCEWCYAWCCPRGSLNYLQFFLDYFFCSNWVFPTTLPSKSLIQSSASFNLLSSLSNVFFILVTVFLKFLTGSFLWFLSLCVGSHWVNLFLP